VKVGLLKLKACPGNQAIGAVISNQISILLPLSSRDPRDATFLAVLPLIPCREKIKQLSNLIAVTFEKLLLED